MRGGKEQGNRGGHARLFERDDREWWLSDDGYATRAADSDDAGRVVGRPKGAV